MVEILKIMSMRDGKGIFAINSSILETVFILHFRHNFHNRASSTNKGDCYCRFLHLIA